MYDFVSYYYNFCSFKISKYKDIYVINYLNNNYYLYEVYDLKKVYKQYYISTSIPFYYRFVINIFNSIISRYHNKYFVLLNTDSLFYKNIKFYKIPFLYINSFKCLWYYQWIKRSEYIENIYLSIKGKYLLIDDSFDYYLGLLEMSIYYLRDYSNYVSNGYIQHERISDLLFYNPLFIKIDIKERDFAEYIKYLFWSGEYRKINIQEFIYNNKDNYNFSLVIARLLYPNYYFDILDQIVFFDEDIKSLEEIVFRTLEFRNYFFNILCEIKQFCNIKKISF